MKSYQVRLGGGEEITVDIRRDGDRLVLSRDGVERSIDLRAMPGAMMHMLVDGKASHDAVVEWCGDVDNAFDGRVNVLVRDKVYHLDVLDERRVRMRDAVGGSDAAEAGSLVAPMPGKVLRVLVEVGDTVEAGQGLVVVEAMKMENELSASGAGVVESVAIAAGDNVDKGALLVSIASAEEA